MAGRVAGGYFNAAPQVWDKAGNQGPVTEADLAVDRALRDTLLGAQPGYGWLSEETDDDLGRLRHDRVFIVDPIDGTRAFIDGGPHWAHSIAVAERCQIIAAAVYVPVPNLLFLAHKGGGATLNGTPIAASPRKAVQGAHILSTKANFNTALWPGGFPGLKRSFRSSLAYRLCLVAEGQFDGMITLRPTWEWDVAAGALIAAEAGAIVTDGRGHAPRFNTPQAHINGFIACAPGIHHGLLQGLGTV